MSEGPVDVTVCVCTRNRAEALDVLLRSLTMIDRPPELSWEVLVVDNGSTDRTADVVSSYTEKLPVRCVIEDRAGVAHARNRVIDEARGVYTCWVDDDVEVDRGWLTAYLAAFQRHPDASLFGGRIIPTLQGPTPPWFARLSALWPVSDLVAGRDFGDTPIPLTFEGDCTPWGANMATRTAELRRVRFDPNLGPSPYFRRTGEETEMIFDLMRTGITGWWVPESRVRHHIVSSRQSRTYFYKYYYAVGETLAYLNSAKPVHYMNRAGSSRSMVSGPAPALYARAAIQATLFGGFHVLRMTRRSLYHLRRVAMYVGAANFKARAGRGAPAPR